MAKSQTSPVTKEKDESIVEKLEQWLPTFATSEAKEIANKVVKEGRDLKDAALDKIDNLETKDLMRALSTAAQVIGVATTAAVVWKFFHHKDKEQK